jgi:transcriptional regulator with XRE-family HTH domain
MTPNVALTDAMQAAGLSDAKIASRVGCSRQLIQFIRTGQRSASEALQRDISLALARELGGDPNDIRRDIFGDVETNPGDATFLERALQEGRS